MGTSLRKFEKLGTCEFCGEEWRELFWHDGMWMCEEDVKWHKSKQKNVRTPMHLETYKRFFR